jgi:N-acetyl-alpha-D-muramate 1-phosphate uridylyltransferase
MTAFASKSAKIDMPKRAIVLAAGLGTRMRPYSDTIPKPLVKVSGKALIDYALDRLADVGVEQAVVNVHYMADMLEAYLAKRKRPRIIISDERDELMGTGGGVVKALPHLGNEPFFYMNSDTLWLDGVKPNLRRMAGAFNPAEMDALLLLAPTTSSIGYDARGDFAMGPDGRLRRRPEREVVPFAYASAAILSPALFVDAPQGIFPLTVLFDRAAEQGRLHGLRIDGIWMHVGTPEAVAEAEATMMDSAA